MCDAIITEKECIFIEDPACLRLSKVNRCYLADPECGISYNLYIDFLKQYLHTDLKCLLNVQFFHEITHLFNFASCCQVYVTCEGHDRYIIYTDCISFQCYMRNISNPEI